jgi:hypothetical protein
LDALEVWIDLDGPGLAGPSLIGSSGISRELHTLHKGTDFGFMLFLLLYTQIHTLLI